MAQICEDMNTVYNGEQIAVDLYDRFVKDIKNLELKQYMVKAMQEHLRHLQDIEVYLEFTGVKPNSALPLAGAFANIKLMMENKLKDDDEMIKTAAEGERMGVSTYENIYGKLKDKKAKDLLDSIIKKDLNIAQRLEGMVNTYGN